MKYDVFPEDNKKIKRDSFSDDILSIGEDNDTIAEKKSNTSTGKTKTSGAKSTSTKKRRKKKSMFKRGMVIYISITLLICFIVFFVFYRFIGAYEKSQTKYGMDDVVKAFENGDVSSYINEETIPGLNPSDLTLFTQKYNSYIAGKPISFEKSTAYTDMTPVFTVLADKEKVADVTLSSHKMKGYNFQEWSFDKMDLTQYGSLVFDPITVSVQAPKGATILLNGKEVTSNNIGSAESVEWLEDLKNYAPELTNYECTQITGLIAEPEVSITMNGAPLVVNKINGIYVATESNVDAAFISEMNDYVTTVLKSYALKFVALQNDIHKYVMPKSLLLETVNTAVTNFYPTSYINTYNFDVLSITDYVKYNDNCFSCKAQYDLHILFKNYQIADTDEEGNFYMYFVKKDNKWYLTSIEYIFE